MKTFLALICTVPLALGSLEPSGYKPPGQRLVAPPPTSYLPPVETFSPSKFYLSPSSPPPPLAPSRQYLFPEGSSTPPPIPLPTTPYLSLDEVSSLPLRSYVPPSPLPSSSLLAPNSRRPTDGYLAPSGAQVKGSAFAYSTPAPLATSVRAPSGRYLGPTKLNAFSGYQYGARDNALGTDAKPAKYEYQYRVNDNYGNDYSHQESRDGDSTWGMFSVLLPDGRRQIVHYDADANGYRPRITYEEPQLAKANQYPKSGPY